MALSDRDKAILDVERSWWTEPGPKEGFIRAQLDMSPTRYYQLLSGLLSSSDAAHYDPLLVRRLRKSRLRRRRARLEGPERPGGAGGTGRPAIQPPSR